MRQRCRLEKKAHDDASIIHQTHVVMTFQGLLRLKPLSPYVNASYNTLYQDHNTNAAKSVCLSVGPQEMPGTWYMLREAGRQVDARRSLTTQDCCCIYIPPHVHAIRNRNHRTRHHNVTYADSSSLVSAHDCVSPAGLMSAASTLTPKNFAAVTHFRGPGPSLLRYMEGVDSPMAFIGGTTEVEAAGDVPAGGSNFAFWGAAFLEAAFLEALSAFFAAFLLGPEAEGAASCSRQMGCEDTSGESSYPICDVRIGMPGIRIHLYFVVPRTGYVVMGLETTRYLVSGTWYSYSSI